MPLWIICDRWIDEMKGWRCVLMDGHEGACSHVAQAEAGRGK